jgi:hypothetical protein
MSNATDGKYYLHVHIQGLPATYNAIGMKSRWVRKRNTDEWKEKVIDAVSDFLPPEPLRKAHCTLIRRSSSPPDFEAIVISMKPCLDGLVEAGVLMDDSLEVIGESKYLWEKVKPKEGSIVIQVQEL